jgi:predicted O-linked N-acetylglucosamine transferase (SPINDLY family)
MKQYALSQSMCEWEALDAWRLQIRGVLGREEVRQVSPFLLLALSGFSAGEQRHCAELWVQDQLAAALLERADLAFVFHRLKKAKLRLGYLSSDFHEHATALLMVELFENHDHDRFEVFAYSCGADDGKGMRQRLEATFDRFTDIRGLSDIEAAHMIYRDEVDILIDLKGYTQGTRSAILNFRPAPIQVNYLGYPGTLGAGVCDYIVTDAFVTPPDSAPDYTEAFAYMPDSYQPHGRLGIISAKPSRAAAGLPAEGFVFCSFNQAYKITPEIFNVWCHLLLSVPDSVLWLLKTPLAEGNLLREAFHRGITADRIIFAANCPQSDHLARLQLADLVLDTAPYNAHTTASDALWVGVPIITCAGDTFPSRVAGSVLHAIGLEELVTTDLDRYFELALALASDADRLAQVKEKLATNRMTTALFGVEVYTRHLETLYDTMWRKYLNGERMGAISTA